MQIRHYQESMSPGIAWSDIASKLLGTYESELHEHIHRYASRRFDTIVNIGCAEGYYAVGFARTFPSVPVLAFDISEVGRALCLENCRDNEVEGRVTIGEEFKNEHFARFAGQQALWLVDIESAEFTLFDGAIGHLSRSCLIIEAHDCVNPAITPKLLDLFGASHAVTVITPSARDPRAIPLLDPVSDIDCWLAVCETRPSRMQWLVCEPKEHRLGRGLAQRLFGR